MDLSAENFIERLKTYSSAEELQKIQRYFKSGKGDYGEDDTFLGVRMGQVYALAREFIEMTPAEIEKLLESPLHEVRAGAMSIMDKQARRPKTPENRRRELFELYLKRTDRINNWDLVDVAAPHVVGGYLFDKPRDVLYKMAHSASLWERRTAIVATFFFIRQGDIADTFKIAEVLLGDTEDLIHKAAGGWVREAGKRDQQKLIDFLDKYAVTRAAHDASIRDRTSLQKAARPLFK